MLAVRVSAFLAPSAEGAVSRSADWGEAFLLGNVVPWREGISSTIRSADGPPPSAEGGKGVYAARRLKSEGMKTD